MGVYCAQHQTEDSGRFLMYNNQYLILKGMQRMIRPAGSEDLDAILDIYNDAIVNTTAVYSYEKKGIDECIQWFDAKNSSSQPVIVYEEDSQVAAFATYGPFRDWPAYKHTIEHSIYVDPDYRNRGIASKMLESLLQIATDEGYKTIVAGIDESNEGSIALHEKYGFEHAGTLMKVGYKFDRWLTLSFYQVMLK